MVRMTLDTALVRAMMLAMATEEENMRVTADNTPRPLTWNEASHELRVDLQPEDFGHRDCPTCEEAREMLRVELAARGVSR